MSRTSRLNLPADKTRTLLNKAMTLAHIGGWEIDLVNQTVYWTDITRQIHEVDDDFVPDPQAALSFYREGADRDYISRQLDKTIHNGTRCNIELQIVTAKGNNKWVRLTGEAEFNKDKCIRIYGSFQDIDDRKKAEIAANKLLEERNVILESIDDAFFATDHNWIVTYWNNTAERVLYKQKEEMLGQNLWEVFADSVNSVSYQKYHQAIATRQAVSFEDHYSPLDKWYEISAYPSESGLSVYFKDITEQKRINEALLDSEKKYSELFHSSPMPMWVFDLHTLKFLDVNMAAEKTYGYTRNEFLQMTIREIRPEEEMPKFEERITQLLQQDRLTQQGIFKHTKKNGDIIEVDIQSNHITYKGQKARIIIANDVTERQKYIKAIEERNEKLVEISWMQSHVVRAPLSRIMGLIQLVKIAEGCDDETGQILDYIVDSANELDEAIKNITQKTSNFSADRSSN